MVPALTLLQHSLVRPSCAGRFSMKARGLLGRSRGVGAVAAMERLPFRVSHRLIRATKIFVCAVAAAGLFAGGLILFSPAALAQLSPLDRALAQQEGAIEPGAQVDPPAPNSALPQQNADGARLPEFVIPSADPDALAASEKIKMIEDEEARRVSRERKIRDAAFEAALNGLLPLEPDEITEVLKRYDRTRKAIELPYYPFPEPKVSILPVSLDPGVVPPILKLAVGYVTTISVLDATGEPWPIEDISWAGDFQISEASGGHIFRITPMADFSYGNISVRLVGLKTPYTVTLQTQREVVEYRVDMRLPTAGPNARAPLIEQSVGMQAGDGLLTAILDGAPPPDLEKLEVSGVDGRTTAYRANGLVYLRTPLTLLSPGWISSARSGDGTSVYILNDTPVVLVSEQGKVRRARLKENQKEEWL